jgi:hypothetical protein
MGVIAIAIALYAVAAMAQTARDIRGPSPLLTIENEPPAKLIVDPPLPGPLAFGRVFIQYRTENLRILPVFGKGALDVSPRVGHLHITVDDAPWHFADGSGETVILVACRSEFVTADAAGGVRVLPLDGPSIGGVGVDIAAELAS